MMYDESWSDSNEVFKRIYIQILFFVGRQMAKVGAASNV